MSGVRLDRFLASTAVALFLSAAPIAALAESMSSGATGTGKATAMPANTGSAVTLTPEPLDSPNLPPIRGAAADTPQDTTADTPASTAPATTATVNEMSAPAVPATPQTPAPATAAVPQPATPAAA